MGDFARCLGYLAVVGLLSATGCAGSNAEKRGGGGSAKLPPQVFDTSDVNESVAALSGSSARCQNGLCACREVDGNGRGSAETDVETAPPAAGYKRFELRTGRGDDTMRITIEGVGTFVKIGPSPEARCIYVDLKPGAYRVRYHVTAANPTQGAEPRLRISEYGEKWKRWYRTFGFRCTDGSQPCSKDLAKDEFERLTKQSDGKFDPCGSTKVQGMRFSTDREADASVGDFNLQLVLSVYKFAPRFAPDTANCKGLSPTKSQSSDDEGEMTVQSAQ